MNTAARMPPRTWRIMYRAEYAEYCYHADQSACYYKDAAKLREAGDADGARRAATLAQAHYVVACAWRGGIIKS